MALILFYFICFVLFWCWFWFLSGFGLLEYIFPWNFYIHIYILELPYLLALLGVAFGVNYIVQSFLGNLIVGNSVLRGIIIVTYVQYMQYVITRQLP